MNNFLLFLFRHGDNGNTYKFSNLHKAKQAIATAMSAYPDFKRATVLDPDVDCVLVVDKT